MLAMLLTRDGAALLPESRAALTRVLVLRETVALCKAVAKLELGPGVNLVLGKVATYIGEQDAQDGENIKKVGSGRAEVCSAQHMAVMKSMMISVYSMARGFFRGFSWSVAERGLLKVQAKDQPARTASLHIGLRRCPPHKPLTPSSSSGGDARN